MKKRLTVIFILIATVMLCACAKRVPQPDPGPDDAPEPEYRTVVASHDTLGCGGYGAVFNAQIDPFNGDYFGATCDMGSVYFSFDTGSSWTRHNIQGTLYCLKYDRTTEGVVWAAGSGVYKSTDHGRTMRLVFPKESELKYADHNYENANYWLYTDGVSDYTPQYQIWSIAIDRKSGGDHVFVGQRVSGGQKSLRIYSTDDGENFSLFTQLDYVDNFKLDYDESNDSLIVVTAARILEIDMDKNVTVIDQPVYVQYKSGNTISFDSYYDAAHNKNTFAFSAPSTVPHIACACYKTNDLKNKASYTDITAELADLRAEDFGLTGIAPENAGRPSYEYCEWINKSPVAQQFDWTVGFVSVQSDDVIYLFHEANTDTFDSDGNFYIKRRTMIYLKYDARRAAGQRYRWIFGNPHKPYNNGGISNTSWQDADSDFCFGMTSSPTNEDALLYCSNVGVYYTADGVNVTQLNSKMFGRDELTLTGPGGVTSKRSLQRVTTTGVDVICTQTMATDPFDSDHLLMGCTDIGLLQSYDNGASWYHGLLEWNGGAIKSIAYATYTNTCFDIHFDRERRNVVYALWSLPKTAPYAPSSSYLTGESRFGVSYDGGLSWTMTKITPDGRGLPYRMQVIYNGSGRDIYVTTFSHGFFVTHDLGATFAAMNAGLDTSDVSGSRAIWGNDLVICDMGIFAATGGAASDQTDNARHMLYKWNDGAARFEKIGLPTSVSPANNKAYTPAAVRDIEYDAKNNCLYLACIANVVNNGSKMIRAAGGIWRYKDGEFTQLYDETVSVFAVNTDSTGRLYATELNGRIARFDASNTTYDIILDGLFHSLKCVCFGATDDILYIPTWGGSTERVILTKEEVK